MNLFFFAYFDFNLLLMTMTAPSPRALRAGGGGSPRAARLCVTRLGAGEAVEARRVAREMTLRDSLGGAPEAA